MHIGDELEKEELIIHSVGDYECPVCGKIWRKQGSGIGFVKSGAKSHVFSCWQKSIEAKGFRLSHKSVGEKHDRYKVISIEEYNRETEEAIKIFIY